MVINADPIHRHNVDNLWMEKANIHIAERGLLLGGLATVHQKGGPGNPARLL